MEFDEARLPEGVMDGLSEEQREEFQYELEFARTRLPLTCSFGVLVQQLKPSRWSASVPSSLLCAQPWGDAVQLFAVDKYGNRVSVPRECHFHASVSLL